LVVADAEHEGHDQLRLILLLGGARSGKSSYAEALAARIAGQRPVLYIATATAEDAEMRDRIARHQAARPSHWRTVEAPSDPAHAIREQGVGDSIPVILLDCVTLLVSNLILSGTHADFDEQSFDVPEAEARVTAAISELLAAWRETQAMLILVSNEVGMGLVPPYPLGRVYRDVLGHVNARLASEADSVLLLVAGLPVELKALAAAWQREARRLFGYGD
jgi:adenosylcobinamide kinase/adenosylcobinamide-phosphate guanylyltransferase